MLQTIPDTDQLAANYDEIKADGKGKRFWRWNSEKSLIE
jgi:hypothetical protein